MNCLVRLIVENNNNLYPFIYFIGDIDENDTTKKQLNPLINEYIVYPIKISFQNKSFYYSLRIYKK